MHSMAGKVVMITGAASGIGRATMTAVHEAGGTVAAADRATITDLHPGDSAHIIDVSDAGATDAAVADVIARHGRIDGLVTCAGLAIEGAVTQFDLAQWERALAVNLTGTMLSLSLIHI